MDSTIKNIRDFPYRVILGKYNEIALKSHPFQEKILTILNSSIKNICAREGIPLQSILNLPGRLVFFFSPEEIPRAIVIFRNIIGLQSIAPAASVPRKFPKLVQGLSNYMSSMRINPNYCIIQTKIVVPYKLSEKELAQELKRIMIEEFKQKNPDSHQSKQKWTIYIEIREKGTYIYTHNIPTIWGGFPIETNKAVLFPFTGSKNDILAASLLIRRGTIVCPVLWNSNSERGRKDNKIEDERKNINRIEGRSGKDNKTNNQMISLLAPLNEIAKFYDVDLPVFQVPDPINDQSLKLLKKRENLKHSSPNNSVIFEAVRLKLLEKIIINSRNKAIYHFGMRNLHFKGVLSSSDLTHFKDRTNFDGLNGQNFAFPLLSPLSGLTKSMQKKFYSLVDFKQENIKKIQESIIKNPIESQWNSFNGIITQMDFEPRKTDLNVFKPEITKIDEDINWNEITMIKNEIEKTIEAFIKSDGFQYCLQNIQIVNLKGRI